MTRFLIVDDHPLFREALQRAVRQAHAAADVYEATSIEGALDVLAAHEDFDLALIDLDLPDVKGFEGLIRIRAAHPKLPIVVVSAFEERDVVQIALSLGVAGYISKSTSRAELALAIGEVLSGSIFIPKALAPGMAEKAAPPQEQAIVKRLRDLTPQQLAVLQLIRTGLQNKQIAYELKLAETTVKAHVSEILRKLNVLTRTNAVIEVGKADFAALRGRGDAAANSAPESVPL